MKSYCQVVRYHVSMVGQGREWERLTSWTVSFEQPSKFPPTISPRDFGGSSGQLCPARVESGNSTIERVVPGAWGELG